MIQNLTRKTHTLPETNMEIQKGPYKDYSPLKRGYMGFHVSLGECTGLQGPAEVRLHRCREDLETLAQVQHRSLRNGPSSLSISSMYQLEPE